MKRDWAKEVEEPARQHGVPKPKLVIEQSPYRRFIRPLHRVFALGIGCAAIGSSGADVLAHGLLRMGIASEARKRGHGGDKEKGFENGSHQVEK